MLLSRVCVALAIADITGAVPAPIKHVLHEKRERHSYDWVKGARVESSAVLPVRIGLTQNNLEKGDEYLMEVSNPRSARYGQYWSAEEVHAMFSPSAEAVDEVREWLHAAGIDRSRVVHSDNKGWLAFDAYAHEAEKLFMTEFYEHRHMSTDGVKIGCDQYHVPEHIQGHVDYITPGVKLTPVVKKHTKAKRASHLAHAKPNMQVGSAIECLGPDSKIFNPQYPSNCPYVTSVGGTMLYKDQTVEDAESVMHVNLGGTATNFSTAGGFSNYFPQPAYQKEAVKKYFEKADLSYPYYSEFSVDLNTTKGLYNRIGRAYPDAAANGAQFRAYTNGLDVHYYGSSLASPLFASVLNLINEERLAIGKGPVGFVNPVLYAFPEVLNDITNGTNAGCGTNGFAAVEGWDPATGLGTPNYPKLKTLYMRLP
ncbi:hypothetical protein PENDEC_c013G01858 [Penicillium decumbens]|uniref:Peptidase S53 domain-containing protein n=1 Tax=Penicillium decumbens TaxID=69771 RepID=A0A1V6PBB4_PENDC|nr:hypothetical protein PENDEC_c013G01858 [Penicillium decumbens]